MEQDLKLAIVCVCIQDKNTNTQINILVFFHVPFQYFLIGDESSKAYSKILKLESYLFIN